MTTNCGSTAACRGACRRCVAVRARDAADLGEARHPPSWVWTTLIGRSSQEITYNARLDSMAEREKRWGAFLADPEWSRWSPGRRRMASSSRASAASCWRSPFSAVK